MNRLLGALGGGWVLEVRVALNLLSVIFEDLSNVSSPLISAAERLSST